MSVSPCPVRRVRAYSLAVCALFVGACEPAADTTPDASSVGGASGGGAGGESTADLGAGGNVVGGSGGTGGGSGPDASAPSGGTPTADAGPGGTGGAGGEGAGGVVPPTPGCEPCFPEQEGIVAGLNQIQFNLNMTQVTADRDRYVPLAWGSPEALGAGREGLAGSLPAPGFLGLVGAGRVVAWAGHEGAFGGGDDGVDDNDAFRTRVLTWLLGGGTRVGFSAGHGEWLRADGLSPAVRASLEAGGASIAPLDGTLDAAALANVDVLVAGNPWGEVSDAEIEAVGAWVEGGGAALVLGLGWSWPTDAADPRGERYPVRRLGARLGFQVTGGSIFDPAAPGGTPDAPAYTLRSAREWTPLEIVVLRAAETDVSQVGALAAGNPDALYVIEGEHMGLSVPTEDWALLNDPVGALDAFDRLYEAEVALVGGVNPPFGGDIVWMVGADAPDAPWWMHSGNPIVFQAAAARSEIIDRLNAEGHPGWGIAHEQGHNMHIGSCGDLFVPGVMTEVWPNIFGLYSYAQNGWDYTAQMGADLFQRGHDHFAQANPDPAALESDPFILLGCLEMILTRYGWEGMQRFVTQAATERAAGREAGDDTARIAYLVEGLSTAYGVDFAPVIAHWGLPVSDASRAVTSAFPAAELP